MFNSNLNNPRSNANGNIGGRSAFRLLNANLGRWFCAARGLWPTGYSRKCRLKGACFRSRLDRAGKNLYCRGGGNATHGLERSLDETLSAGNDGDSNAWPVVCNFGWLIEADRNARKGKRYRAEVLNFTARLEDNLFTIQQGMMNGSYVLGPYRKLWVYVPKKRLVMALDYPDRIVQWSLYLYLNPIYDRLFIEDSYACRKGKGSHKAAKRLQYWMCQVQRKPGPGWYCLKLDISKYFYRVNHEKLLAILERRVKDPAMMAFIRGVVNSRAEPFGLPRWRTPQDTLPEEWLYEVGMPIGNLTSQLFANIYLNELDQYCKHRLKIHYYIRYMDDVII